MAIFFPRTDEGQAAAPVARTAQPAVIPVATPGTLVATTSARVLAAASTAALIRDTAPPSRDPSIVMVSQRGEPPSMHVKLFLTVFYVTAGRAPYVPHPMAKNGHERSQTGVDRDYSTISEDCVSAGSRQDCLLRTGGQGQGRTADLPLFRLRMWLPAP